MRRSVGRPMSPKSPTKCRGWPVSARIGYYTGPREPNGCRLWLGTAGRRPTLYVGGRHVIVARLILGLASGDPRVAMHSCDSPRCVEPSHLSIGTDFDNMRDCVAKKRHASSRKTHCKHGHPFDEANTSRRESGRRACKACNRARMRRLAASECDQSTPPAAVAS